MPNIKFSIWYVYNKYFNCYSFFSVILTLSSDEDEKDDSPTTNKSSLSFQENIDGHTNQHGFSEPINPKEPIIKPKSKYENYQRHYNNMPGLVFLSFSCVIIFALQLWLVFDRVITKLVSVWVVLIYSGGK